MFDQNVNVFTQLEEISLVLYTDGYHWLCSFGNLAHAIWEKMWIDDYPRLKMKTQGASLEKLP